MRRTVLVASLAVALGSLVRWLARGPARLAQLEQQVQVLEQSVLGMQHRQEAELANLRGALADALDDITARRGVDDPDSDGSG